MPSNKPQLKLKYKYRKQIQDGIPNKTLNRILVKIKDKYKLMLPIIDLADYSYYLKTDNTEDDMEQFYTNNMYENTNGILEFKCYNDHIIEKSPNNILYLSEHCPFCPSEKFLDKLSKLAKQHDATYKIPKDRNEPISFTCKNKHVFEKSYQSATKVFCIECNREQITKDDIINIIPKNAKILKIPKIIYKTSSIKFECENNHIFNIQFNKIKQHFCYKCYKK